MLKLTRKYKILFIEDEVMNIDAIEMLTDEYFEFTRLLDPSELERNKIDLKIYDAVMLDLIFNEHLSMKEKLSTPLDPLKGKAALSWIRMRDENIPVFIHSGYPIQSVLNEYQMRFKNVHLLPKPTSFDDDVVKAMVEVIEGKSLKFNLPRQ